ncbi:radical SAM family heme chaperone HemW [Pseudanabaena sp. PCC 6802]|uniref:radical SAM family heme chaperone HemW n=1 Tax=Pseudanabaena sp. PCC 6802 TaxID=118173 RepID=UPI00034CE866|nr:radical SAM family heme chaperone HemW [Pseudanabaena sp. PCC 6802]
MELVESIYLHIPFCLRRCFYCDFAITTGGQDLKARYVDAICWEIVLTAAEIQQKHCPPLQTIFFGGGTPSLLDVRQIATILETIDRQFGIADDVEISLEANPGTVTLESLRGYRSAGVNRISLGAQAFQQELLDLAGRGHGVDDIYTAVEAIALAGITNFSLDLISGLPHQNMHQWQESLARAIALQPTHLSVYDLTIEPSTAFGKRYQAGDRPLPTEAATVEMYLSASAQLQAAGYTHYEISNYARSGYQCRHNLTYWHNRPFYGVGMGATSYVDKCRIDRPRKLRDYFEMVAAWRDRGIAPNAPPTLPKDELLDTLMQGLRLAEGISLHKLNQNYGKDLVARALTCLQPYFQKGWAQLIGDRQDYLSLSVPEGWLFSNEIIADLFEAIS